MDKQVFTIHSSQDNSVLGSLELDMAKAYGILSPQVDVARPSAVQNLEVVSNFFGNVVLQWDQAQDDVAVIGYQIYKNGSPFTTRPVTDFVDTTNNPLTTVTYGVQAFDAAGNTSDTITEVTIVTTANLPPVWHDVVSQTMALNSAFFLDFNDYCFDPEGHGTISFSIVSGTLPSGLQFNSSLGTISGQVSVPFGPINLVVSGSDGHDSSEQTWTLRAVDNIKPTAPVVSLLGVTRETIAMQWAPSVDDFGIFQYKIMRRHPPSGIYSVRATVGSQETNYTDSGLSPVESWDYQIIGVDDSPQRNESDPSNTLSATTSADFVNAFSFAPVTGAPVSTVVTSASMTVGGNLAAVPVSVTGGTYSKNGGAFTSAAGSAVAGDIIRVQLTAAATPNTAASATLTVGDKSATFTVTTAGATNTWPADGILRSASYSIGSSYVDQLGTEPFKTYLANKDVVIFQTLDITNQTQRDQRRTLQSGILARNPKCKLVPYDNFTQVKKDANVANIGRYKVQLINSSEGHPNWYRRNTAGQITEHDFNPVDDYALNTAVHIAGTNSLGENFTQAAFRKMRGYLTQDAQQLLPLSHGMFFDVTSPMPKGVTISNGTVSTNTDYNDDGVADNISSNTIGSNANNDGGARMHRRGQLQMLADFDVRLGPDGYQAIFNGGRFDFDYTDNGTDDPPLPLSQNEWYGQIPGSVREFSHTSMGITNIVTSEGGGTANSFIYGSSGSPSQFFRTMEISRKYLKPPAQTRWGQSFVVADVDMNYRKSVTNGFTMTQEEAEFLRFYALACMLVEQCVPGHKCGKREPISVDEELFYLGLPLAVRSMGTLSETGTPGAGSGMLAFTMRAPNFTSGSAQFYWVEFTEAIVVVRLDRSGISNGAAYPSAGTAVSCPLPSPGAGKVWRMFNSNGYVNPNGRGTTYNQSPSINNGQIVTSVSLRQCTARAVRRANS